MDPMLLRVFQDQVILHCQFVLYAAEDLNAAINEKDGYRTFFAIHNLLNAAANISKVLWGAGGRFAASREPVRDSVSILDSSPLKIPSMRDNFEHYDERVDYWWKESKRHGHVDLNVGPRTSIVGVDDIDLFRWFDPKTKDVVFWSQEFNIQDIVDEVQRILPILERATSNQIWPPSEK